LYDFQPDDSSVHFFTPDWISKLCEVYASQSFFIF
jgi:hypothetical protein